MSKLTFWGQIKLGLLFVVAGFLLGTLTKNGIFCNIGHGIYGLLFLINPVPPAEHASHPKIRLWIRIAGGFIFVFLGFFTRFGV